MLSQLFSLGRQSFHLGANISGVGRTKVQQNLACKRWGGHGPQLHLSPSYFDGLVVRDLVQYYLMLVGVPISVIVAIINIRANPELTEIPEGYEPRHWEYYRHPIARFMAKYLFYPLDTDTEMLMAWHQQKAEQLLIKKLHKKVDHVMSFYNDHRSLYFKPIHGDYVRRARDHAFTLYEQQKTSNNIEYEAAHEEENGTIPVEGYHTRLD